MQWTGLNELREKFLEYFESKEHLRLPSFSLIPQGDNSLLLINSGMAPMKKYFTGEVTPPRRRVTTCQKCIRTGDIENVGYTDRHGTYFEMLGNFSFGDYFKREAISFAWEFFTQVLEMPKGVIPITTITMGYPAEEPALSDRLPLKAVVHYETYRKESDEDIRQLYYDTDHSELTKRLLEENQLPNLAQVFTQRRYTKKDNEAISAGLVALLKENRFLE